MQDYINKINNLYNDYVKEYNRKDQTFEMYSIESMLEELESSKDYTQKDKSIISKYLYERYSKDMIKWKEKIEERKQQGWYY